MVAGAALAAAVLFAATLLTPLPAALVRIGGLALLERQFGILGTVEGLALDVARLRITIDGLRLAAPGYAREPFLRAAEARVDVSWRAIWGGAAIEVLELRGAAVSVIRRRDGSSNLPVGVDGSAPRRGGEVTRDRAAGEAGRPASLAVPIGRLAVDDLAVDWRDDQAGFGVHLAPTTVTFVPRPGAGGGTVAMDGMARASWRGSTLRFTRLAGEIEFDGSAVGLRRLELSGPDLALTLDGRVDSVLQTPRLAMTYEADVDLAWIAALLSASPAAGRLAAGGAITGTPDRLELSSVLTGGGIEMRGVAADRVHAALRLTPAEISVEELRVELAGGSVSAAGRVERAPGWPGQLDATWNGLDVDRLLAVSRAAPPLALRAVAGGSLAARWPTLGPRMITARVEAQLRADGARGAGLRLDADDGRWRVTLDQSLADAVSVSGAAEAVLPAGAIGRGGWTDAPLAGELELTCVDVGRCSRLLAAGGPAEAVAALGGAVNVRLAIGGTLGSPVATGRLAAPELVAGGGAAAGGVEARLYADSDEIRADAIRVRAGSSTGSGQLRVQLPGGALAGAFAATLSDLAAPGRLAPGEWAPAGRGQVDVAIAGTVRQVAATASYRFTEVHVAGRNLGAVNGTAAWAAGDYARADLRVPALGARVDAALDNLAGEPWFRVRGRAVDADVARLAPPAVPLTGRVTLSVAAEGPPGNLAASALELRIDEAVAGVGGLTARLARPAAVSFGPAGLRAEDLELAFGRSRLQVDGGLGPGGAGTLTAALSGRIADLAAVAAPLGVLPAGVLDGDISLDLAATGTPDAFELTGGLGVDDGSIALAGYPALAGLTARAALADGVLRIDSLRADWAGAAIDGSGELPVELGLAWLTGAGAAPPAGPRRPAAARVEVSALRPAALAGFVDAAWLDRLTGQADATIELELPTPGLAGARGRLALSEASFAAAGVPLAQRRPTEIVLEGGRALFRSFDWGNATSSVAVGGHLQLGADARAELSVAANLDLRALNAFMPALGALGAAAAGSATVNARLAGPVRRPDVSGRVDIAGGELHVAAARLTLTDVDGALLLAANRVTTADLKGSVNGGSVEIGGGWSLAGAGARNAFTVAGEGLALETPRGLRSEADVDLALIGGGDGLELTGRVDLLRGAYREPFVLSGGLFELLEREPGLATLDAGGRADVDLRLDLRVVTGDDIQVANNYVDAELGGDLRVGGTLRNPAVTGRAALREGGRVRFGARVYEIETGAVDFIDPGGIVPALTLEARTRAGGYDITLEAGGSGGAWTTSLRSEPPLPESDIASVLLTGRPLDQAASGFAANAREQALGLASSELLTQVGRGLGVDVRIGANENGAGGDVVLDPSLVATHLNPASRLTVGRDLRDNARLVFSRGLSDDTMAWLADYLPRNDLELRALFDGEQRRAYEFRHVLTAGAPPAARPPAAGRGGGRR